MINKYLSVLLTVTFIFLSSSGISHNESFINFANAQSSSCYNGVVTTSQTTSDNNFLPVVLVHGYAEDSTVWNNWEIFFQNTGIPYCTVTFEYYEYSQPSYDECGSSEDHAIELDRIIHNVKTIMHVDQVNIVGHSKGGLDARLYLHNSQTPDVANLIMIGTPNAGGPLADFYASADPCKPAVFDLKTGAPVTHSGENANTGYHTIYGDWDPSLSCSYYWLNVGNYNYLYWRWHLPNDGIVPQWSVESKPYFNHLGSTTHCHQDLLGKEEYQLSEEILMK